MISQILNNIFIGDCYDAMNSEALQKLRINVILNVSNISDANEKRLAKSLNIEYFFRKFVIEGEDPDKVRKRFHSTSRLLWQITRKYPEANILIHCGAGQERSPLVVALFIMDKLMVTLPQAYDIIAYKRPQILRRYDWA